MASMKDKVSCRVLSSERAYVEWLATFTEEKAPVGREGFVRSKAAPVKEGEREKRGASANLLVPVSLPSWVFRRYVNERVKLWAKHNYEERHQLKARGASVAAVGHADPGTRLAVLIDWSEKLSLEPH
jgi:hypothetical protein